MRFFCAVLLVLSILSSQSLIVSGTITKIKLDVTGVNVTNNLVFCSRRPEEKLNTFTFYPIVSTIPKNTPILTGPTCRIQDKNITKYASVVSAGPANGGCTVTVNDTYDCSLYSTLKIAWCALYTPETYACYTFTANCSRCLADTQPLNLNDDGSHKEITGDNSTETGFSMTSIVRSASNIYMIIITTIVLFVMWKIYLRVKKPTTIVYAPPILESSSPSSPTPIPTLGRTNSVVQHPAVPPQTVEQNIYAGFDDEYTDNTDGDGDADTLYAYPMDYVSRKT